MKYFFSNQERKIVQSDHYTYYFIKYLQRTKIKFVENIMGNIFSSNEREFTLLKDRIQNLEAYDKNRDGLISKEEFENWQKTQAEELEIFRQKIITMKDREYSEKLNDLKKQLETLKNINQDLNQKLVKQTTTIDVLENTLQAEGKVDPLDLKNALFSQNSKERIQEVVERMIQNDAVNIDYLPDFVEKQLYQNVFTILLGLVNELVEGSSIELLGHKIDLKMKALPDQD